MQIETLSYKDGAWFPSKKELKLRESADFLLVFGKREILCETSALKDLEALYPNVLYIGCTTSGEIHQQNVIDNSVQATAVKFKSAKVKAAEHKMAGIHESFAAGCSLARALMSEELRHVFVLSDGIKINGAELVKGLSEVLPTSVSVTGGLAGDGREFRSTGVFLNKAPEEQGVVALGLYGDSLRIGYGCFAGWDPFGPVRLMTKTDGHTLYELDGKPALDLYKAYLGEKAKDLPSSALYFPMSIRRSMSEEPIMRSILSIDEEKKAVISPGGDLPQGAYVQFIKANPNRLIEGAIQSASKAYEPFNPSYPELAILISCIGRRYVLEQSIEEEVEAVQSILNSATTTGFYSYGEIAPLETGVCELHNQTMTITTLAESDE